MGDEPVQDGETSTGALAALALGKAYTHGQDLLYTGGELSGLVSKRLNK